MKQFQSRSVAAAYPARREDIGDLVTRRPSPPADRIDPFLFIAHHGPQTYGPNNQGLPFGPHPHRGFETVTFILDGELTHSDSTGQESTIRAGGVQWMTAGSGVIHAELSPETFRRDGGPMEILQLWVNLPARLKMSAPAYHGLQASALPSFTADDGRVTVDPVSGRWGETTAPVQSLYDVDLAVLRFQPDGVYEAPIPAGRHVFLYVARGEVAVGSEAVPTYSQVVLNDAGDGVRIEASSVAIVILGHGQPIGEPVFSHGPFVMNTREEIIQAIEDYNAGRFGPPPKVA